MKRSTVLLCLLLFAISEASAVGLDSKAMAMKTSYSTLQSINNLKTLPIGLDVNAYINSKNAIEADDDYILRAQTIAILLAINFTLWDKYAFSVDYGNKISSLIPLLLMAQMPISKISSNANSILMQNLILGIWLGYYMNGYKDSDSAYTFKNKFSIFMVGVLATLYLNELLTIQNCAVLFYFTLKMGVIFEKDTWEFEDNKDSESWTKFGVFPAIGAEYFFTKSLAVFAAIGYNPFGWAEFGVRLNVGK